MWSGIWKFDGHRYRTWYYPNKYYVLSIADANID